MRSFTVLEQNVMIPVNDKNTVEAHLAKGIFPKAAVICHPHPLYGGSMDNNVVLAMQAAFRELGWSALRFNFRGVGRSSGEYADGIGEREDLRAVCRFLREQTDQVDTLCVVGYSFGAWVVLGAIGEGLALDRLILVSPPLDFMQFDGLRLPSVPCLITLGERDDFCRLASLDAWLATQPETGRHRNVVLVPGGDHFYWGKEGLLKDEIKSFTEKPV
jgi:uncharacterized protein